MMCYTDWMTLDDDGGEEDELFYVERKHLWEKKELKVHFMNSILTCYKDPLTPTDIIDIANDWHRAGEDVVPKFVCFREESGSDIRVRFIGKGRIIFLA